MAGASARLLPDLGQPRHGLDTGSTSSPTDTGIGGGWADSAALAATAVDTGTSPSAFRNSNGIPRIHYTGDDAKLREVAYTGTGASGWEESGPLIGVVPANTTQAHSPGPAAVPASTRGSRLSDPEIACTPGSGWARTYAISGDAGRRLEPELVPGQLSPPPLRSGPREQEAPGVGGDHTGTRLPRRPLVAT